MLRELELEAPDSSKHSQVHLNEMLWCGNLTNPKSSNGLLTLKSYHGWLNLLCNRWAVLVVFYQAALM